MRKYKDIPNWWFYVMLALSLILSLALCIFMNDQIQMPWWGLIFASGLALTFTLPVSIITATTNQVAFFWMISEFFFYKNKLFFFYSKINVFYSYIILIL